MSKPRQKDNVQCAFCGKKMQLRSIGGHWRMLGHPNNVNLDDRYLCIEEESSSTSDSSSNANDSSSNDGSTTTSNDGSSSNDEDDSDEEEIQDTIPMDVDNEDHSPPRQRLTIPTMFKHMLDNENEELNLMTNKSYLERRMKEVIHDLKGLELCDFVEDFDNGFCGRFEARFSAETAFTKYSKKILGTVLDRILNDDTLEVDVIVQDEEQKREFSESDDEADGQNVMNDDDGIDDDQFFDAELMDVINAHFERLEDEDVQQRPDDVEEEEKGEELDD
eukprot:348978_1